MRFLNPIRNVFRHKLKIPHTKLFFHKKASYQKKITKSLGRYIARLICLYFFKKVFVIFPSKFSKENAAFPSVEQAYPNISHMRKRPISFELRHFFRAQGRFSKKHK